MATKTCTPNSISQTSGGKFQTFSNTGNIKTVDSNYAECFVHGKNQTLNRPATISTYNFKCNLPTGAMVTKVTVKYKHSKAAYKGSNCNVQAPTLSLWNNTAKFNEKKGTAPTTTATERSVEFVQDMYEHILNRSTFYVKIDYPTNSNNSEGYVRLYYVKIIIEYKTSSYGLTISHIRGEYNGDTYELNLTVSNKNLTRHHPTITLTTPSGFSIQNTVTTTGEVNIVNPRTITFTPQFTKTMGSSSLNLRFDTNITYAAGVETYSGTFVATENLNNTTTSRTVTVTKTRPSQESSDEGEDENSLNITDDTYTHLHSAKVDEEIYVSVELEDWLLEEIEVDDEYTFVVGGSTIDNAEISWKDDGTWKTLDSTNYEVTGTWNRTDNVYSFTIKGGNPGVYEIPLLIYYEGTNDTYSVNVGKFLINIIPTTLSVPASTIISLSQEELNRLGDGEVYTAETLLEVPGKKQLFASIKRESLTTVVDAHTSLVLPTSILSDLPQQFELSYGLRTDTTACRLGLCSVENFTENANPPYYIYGGFSTAGYIEIGNRETDTSSVQGDTTTTQNKYYTFKIVRDGTTFDFYVNDEYFTTKTVSWFDNYEEYCLVLFNSRTGTTEVNDIRLTTGDGETYVRDWGGNFRIGVFNNAITQNISNYTVVDNNNEITEIAYDTTDYNTITTNQIISNAEYWSDTPTQVNTYTNLTCQFPYNKDYPVYIIVTGDYHESNLQTSINFTEPCIIESEVYHNREDNGTYPVPINDIILNDGSSAEMLISELNSGSELVFYDFPFDEDFGTNEDIAIRGLELRCTIESNTDNLILYASLKNANQETRSKSIILDEVDNSVGDENTFSIGGVGDLWGFSTLDILNLRDWEVHFQASNSLNESVGNINFGNVQFIIYIEPIESQNIRAYIDGEDLTYYGAFLTDLKVPEGLKTDVDYININGTDVNDPYRQNIKEKTIEVHFEVGDNCDLETATKTLREIARLLVNKRDKYNRPIPKRIEFSHYPNLYWEYILEDTLDNDIQISSYEVKAKLVVPAGTAYDKVATTTNTAGYVNGLAYIRPIIQFKPSSNSVSIVEERSSQEFNMSYKDDWIGKTVEIDCDNRRVYLKNDEDDSTGTNISQYVDFNSDWFTLLGDYNFKANGCAIATVSFKQRW